MWLEPSQQFDFPGFIYLTEMHSTTWGLWLLFDLSFNGNIYFLCKYVVTWIWSEFDITIGYKNPENPQDRNKIKLPGADTYISSPKSLIIFWLAARVVLIISRTN